MPTPEQWRRACSISARRSTARRHERKPLVETPTWKELALVLAAVVASFAVLVVLRVIQLGI